MTEQEAQQAQTIVEGFNGWKFSAPWESLAENIKWTVDFLEDANALAQAKFFVYLIERCRHNESLVDSQAQQIANMAERIDLQTQWMIDHGITDEELGKILTQLADSKEVAR